MIKRINPPQGYGFFKLGSEVFGFGTLGEFCVELVQRKKQGLKVIDAIWEVNDA